MHRRELLKGGAGALALVLTGIAGHAHGRSWGGDVFPTVEAYGRLRRDGDHLAVPPGFTVRLLSEEGRSMGDGRPTPPLPDGMAAFALADGTVRLVRNHEVERQPVAGLNRPRSLTYDPMAWGGVSVVDLDPATLDVIGDGLVLAGTLRNCNGGRTPWGSWLSCEETISGPATGLEADHGYVFEVPADAPGLLEPVPLRHLGRFVHEAVAVCERHHVLYQTEDADHAPFYRWTPATGPDPNGRIDLTEPGTLEALAVVDDTGVDLSSVVTTGATWTTTWVTIDEPDPAFDLTLDELEQLDASPVGTAALDRGAARFRRLEGCSAEGGTVWFTSTDGGAGHGQVWRYEPADDEGGTLTMVFASPRRSVLSGPDSLCVSPKGGILLCEDTERQPNRVVVLTTAGHVVPLVANVGDDEEFAGACFSPDGGTLFVNTMGDRDDGLLGRTFAVRGPWDQGPV
ncbi:MAG: alkaline phosphatase PhoX [Actinomycetota bacterium]